MSSLDWWVILLYCIASLALGLALTKKATQSTESYFASGRTLSWWLAGTSMAATAFSSDTPLLVTGIVRRRGIWGNWEIWALGISTMFAVFFFSRLWKRAGVMTEVEFVELRYSGRAAAWLRGFKALYWGIFYNAFIMGAWPVTGLVKVMQETTQWSKAESIFFCMGLTAIYTSLSGYWGVILTDFFQFVIAMMGAFLLASYAIQAAGGFSHIAAVLEPTGKLNLIPPLEGSTAPEMLNSPFGWFLSLILIQWWAWKNTDGGGIIVQRIASCKNERHAILATLWFNIAQYALRSWPWILTALASLILLPDLTDHERAYPRLIKELMPSGMRGLMVASFFAAFMSTMSTHLNWGSSYFVHDFYQRFVRKNAPEKHYVLVARWVPVFLTAMAAAIAFMTESIGEVYTWILNLTAVIGPVYFLRWFWWRINPASEIAAMAASLPLIWMRPAFFSLGWIPENPITLLLYMVLGGAMVWLPATLFFKPCDEDTLENFYRKTRPPGFWNQLTCHPEPFGACHPERSPSTPLGMVSLSNHEGSRDPSAVSRPQDDRKNQAFWKNSLYLWIISTAGILLIAIGPLEWMLRNSLRGASLTGLGILCWIYIAVKLPKAIDSRLDPQGDLFLPRSKKA